MAQVRPMAYSTVAAVEDSGKNSEKELDSAWLGSKHEEQRGNFIFAPSFSFAVWS